MAFITSALCHSGSNRQEGREPAYSDLPKWMTLAILSFQVHKQIQVSNFLVPIKKPLILFHLRILQFHSGILCSFIWHAGPPSGQLWTYVPTLKKFILGMLFALVLKVQASSDIKFTFLLIWSHNSIPWGYLYQGNRFLA